MSLPATSDTFFGRESELEAIASYLADPQARLITLVGPGGIGKTRLGIEAARIHRDRTGSQVVFVDLQAAEQPSQVENALADALRITLTERGSIARQIADYFADGDYLLLLDNFEQVVDAAPTIGELVDVTSGLKVLVTSRLPLRLTQEWLLPIDGLAVPQPVRLRDATLNPSVCLFIDRVRKVKPDLSVAQEMPAIERVCRLSGGMPLALEIAASWAHILGVSEIADDMAHDTQFLSSGLRNVSDRHRSVQLVFEHSMRLLDAEERAAFNRLSIFAGGFTRAAAQDVAGASQAMLRSLVERSLVKHDADGRYRLHELLCQYAAEELAKSPEEVDATRNAHCRYFMAFLIERWEAISCSDEVKTAAEVEAEYENIRAAWSLAVANRWYAAVCDAAETLSMFFQFRGRYVEASEFFQGALRAFQSESLQTNGQEALAQLLAEHGWFSLRLGRIDDAERAFQESANIREAFDIPVRGFAVDPGLGLGYVAATRGDLTSSRELATDALQRAEAGVITISHAAVAGYLLAHLASRQGDSEYARTYAKAALATSHQIGERWFSAFCHQILGEVEGLAGNVELAMGHFQSSLDINIAFEDRAGAATSRVFLGELSLLGGRFQEAYFHFEQSRDAYLQAGDRGGAARAEAGLGLATEGLGDARTAAQWYRSAQDTAVAIGLRSVVFDVMASIGTLGLSGGLEEDSGRLLSFVARQDAIEARTRLRVKRVLPPQIDGEEGEEHKTDAYLALAYSILDRIAAAPQVKRATRETESGADALRSMSEPLTNREMEILALVAQGLSNQQIANRLVVSVSTVKWHNYQIYAKLGVNNRTSAIAAARLVGALPGGPSV
jgi:predicted ATPase/DNA-binding CsgD family transcriptional regulator